MRFDTRKYFDFKDVLIKPKRSGLTSRSQVNLLRTFKFLHSKREWCGVPILVSNMANTGTFEMYKVFKNHKMITVLHKYYSINDYPLDMDRNYYSLTTGIGADDWVRTEKLIEKLNPYFLTIDIANGYCDSFVEFCKMVRQKYPDLTIFAGNVATGDMVQELLLTARVDVVKCGIGPGSVCSTRIKTGVGVPQLSVCSDCSEVANGLNGYMISDGGCTVPGDIAKAFCAGAHFVMIGGMVGGSDEAGGDTIGDGKYFYGMSSKFAQDKYNGGMKKYRASEGKLRKIQTTGPVVDTILDIFGSLRSTGTYIGASNIKDFPKCTTFLEVKWQHNTIFD
jgi:GMP reductase